MSAKASPPKRLFISDCEGPISKNDNACELSERFIPRGASFFALISKYDDVQADIVKRSRYNAGDTLRLILPFLKAYGVTNEKMTKFSMDHILLVRGAKETLRFINNLMPSFIVSTSFEQYIHALCSKVDFPCKNVYCTELDLDRYQISKEEVERLRQLEEEITGMNLIEIPDGAVSVNRFSKRDKKTIRRLDDIFWQEIAELESGRMLKEVNPVGGVEKARAIEDIMDRMSGRLSDMMYVGDSITDVQSFQLVRQNDGLTVSFNGNHYAVREAEVAVLSNNTTITSVLADIFSKFGRSQVVKLVEEWSYSALKRYRVTPTLRNRMIKLYPEALPQVEIITSKNKERLAKESNAFRKAVRGEAIGRLG